MIRRLCALLLTLACALAPVLPARATPAAKAESCCCGAKCACETDACLPPPAAPVRAPEVTTTAVEQRTIAAKPAARIAFARLFAFSEKSALPVRPVSADRVAPAASVALYEAHCSRLL